MKTAIDIAREKRFAAQLGMQAQMRRITLQEAARSAMQAHRQCFPHQQVLSPQYGLRTIFGQDGLCGSPNTISGGLFAPPNSISCAPPANAAYAKQTPRQKKVRDYSEHLTRKCEKIPDIEDRGVS